MACYIVKRNGIAMMSEIEVNSYICAAQKALNDDPVFQDLFSALVKERKSLSEKGCNTGTIEALLFSIWNQRIGYILDHLDEINLKIAGEQSSPQSHY